MYSEREKLEDRELVAKFKATGDGQYFAVLFDRYQKRVWAICFAIFENRAMAEDLVQETFVRAFEQMASFDERDSQSQFRAWLGAICRNACYDELRKLRVRAEYQAESRASGRRHFGEQSTDGRASVRGSTYEPQELMIIFRQLDEELAKLPEKKRECWRLFHDWGYSYKEIAEIMDLSFEEVKTNIRSVNRHLERIFR